MQKIKYICDRCRTEQATPFTHFIRSYYTIEREEPDTPLKQHETVWEDYELCSSCYNEIIRRIKNYDR